MCVLFPNIQFHTQRQNIITRRNSVWGGWIIRYANITRLFSPTLIIYKWRYIITCVHKIVFLFGILYVCYLFSMPKIHSSQCFFPPRWDNSDSPEEVYVFGEWISQVPFNTIFLIIYHVFEYTLHPCITLSN